MLPEDLEFTTVGFLARAADFALSAGDPRVDRDSIADFESRSRANRIDFTRAVGADDVRKGEGNPLYSLGEEQVEVIEGRGVDPDSDLTLSRHRRLGQVHHRERLRAAESG
jgi:hypothetical protein